MSITRREHRRLELKIGDTSYLVEVLEIPFREGLEMRTFIGEKEFRVSDRGLGEHEALRLLKEEIEAAG